MEQRKMTCIVCPLGCEMTVDVQDGKIEHITGHSCKRGITYATDEVVDPRRTLTTTMRVLGGEFPVVSVKTDKPVPKGSLFACMKQINATVADAPVKIGDVLIENILGTGANIVATIGVPCYNSSDENDCERNGGTQRAASS